MLSDHLVLLCNWERQRRTEKVTPLPWGHCWNMISLKCYLISFMCLHKIFAYEVNFSITETIISSGRTQKKYFHSCLDCLLAGLPVEWRLDRSAPLHDSGMIKDLYYILILLLCCQLTFPVSPHTSAQTYAAVHNLTVEAENGKPLSCDGKTECIISIRTEWCRGTGKTS